MGRRALPANAAACERALPDSARQALEAFTHSLGFPRSSWPGIPPLREVAEVAGWVSRTAALVAQGQTLTRARYLAGEELGLSADAVLRRLGEWHATVRVASEEFPE